MLSNIGNLLIFFTVVTSLLVIFKSSKLILSSANSISKNIYQLSIMQSTFSIMSFVVLVIGFVISDFSLITVFQNSHTTKPLIYKISGTWGNHEGSLLLWINVLTIFSYLFLVFSKKFNNEFRLGTIITQNFLLLGFLAFLLFNSNPFSYIFPVPLEGLGLNPILQDPALAIHPPLLYIGFVGSSIYFSAAISSLFTNFGGKQFALSIKPWVIISWVFQTLGILVGSIWAYYELGWGGFWFWDPVENASLMPWFVMTALMHSLIVLEKRGTLYNWVVIMCLTTFTLTVTGTFLVRSGILNSVHTFANDPSRGLFILMFLSVMILFSIITFLKKFKLQNYLIETQSKETLILLNNWIMIFFLATILIGTVYPIFTEVLINSKISVGPPFYNTILIPVVIPILFLMAVAPRVGWIKAKFSISYYSLFVVLFALLINFLIQKAFKSYSWYSNLIIISSIFLIIYTLIDLFRGNFKKDLNNRLSRIISHLGFGLLIFFIGINHTLTIEKDFNLKVGETKNFLNYQIKFKSLDLEEKKNYKAVVGNFEILNKMKKKSEKLTPEIRIYDRPETITYEASIKSNISHDLYLTMSNIQRTEFYNIKFQEKPFMIWIWVSVILIALGGITKVFRNESNT